MKQAVLVSPEMTSFIGEGGFPDAPIADDAVIFAFRDICADAMPLLHFRDDADLVEEVGSPLVLAVARSACRRLFPVRARGAQCWYLPSALRSLALSIIECEAGGEAGQTLQLARSIELLCQIHASLANGGLVPRQGTGELTQSDVATIARARRVLDLHWNEKLTIAALARMVGVNRDKLVRGFRDIYGTTIAEVLAERRLAEARAMLMTSDLPVATVAYRCSYLNNASFSRAFARRYGVAPSDMRKSGIAA